jgi:hypothetical protein
MNRIGGLERLRMDGNEVIVKITGKAEGMVLVDGHVSPYIKLHWNDLPAPARRQNVRT